MLVNVLSPLFFSADVLLETCKFCAQTLSPKCLALPLLWTTFSGSLFLYVPSTNVHSGRRQNCSAFMRGLSITFAFFLKSNVLFLGLPFQTSSVFLKSIDPFLFMLSKKSICLTLCSTFHIMTLRNWSCLSFALLKIITLVFVCLLVLRERERETNINSLSFLLKLHFYLINFKEEMIHLLSPNTFSATHIYSSWGYLPNWSTFYSCRDISKSHLFCCSSNLPCLPLKKLRQIHILISYF